MIYIKRESDTMDDYRRDHHPSQSRSPDPSIPICSVTNENWRGKNDPAERRRIQNRINQRAFRQRQRAGESPKQYKPRSNSSGPNSQADEDEQQTSSPEQDPQPYQNDTPRSVPGAVPNGVTDPSTGRVVDELAQLINRNLMSAAANNAQQLGLDSAALSGARPILTPRVANSQLPAALQPISLQHQIPHDPIIDIIPHPRFRYNILRAMATQQLDPAAFSAALRASGALENVQGSWLRGGLVVWSSPDQLASWELSESFVRRFGLLLQGCDDLLAATNAWRSRRGERLFTMAAVEGR